MWRDVSGTVGGGGNDGSNGRWTVVSSDTVGLPGAGVGVVLSIVAICCHSIHVANVPLQGKPKD